MVPNHFWIGRIYHWAMTMVTHQFLKILQISNDAAMQDHSPALRPPREKGPAPLGRTQRVHRAKTHLISSYGEICEYPTRKHLAYDMG